MDDDRESDVWHLAPGDTLSGHRVVVDGGGREVFLVFAMEPGDEEATRRGRMAAAAPDYHEAVFELLGLWPLSGYELEAYMGAMFIPAVRAAFKKAEGTS